MARRAVRKGEWGLRGEKRIEFREARKEVYYTRQMADGVGEGDSREMG